MRRLEITILTDAGSILTGYGSREFLTEQRGRVPVFATIARGWCTQTCKVPDLVAAAERQGFDVRIFDKRGTEPREIVPAPEPVLSVAAARKARLFRMLTDAPPVEQPDPGRLW